MILTSFYAGQTLIVSGWAKNPLAWIIAEITNQQFNHKVGSIKLVIECSRRFNQVWGDAEGLVRGLTCT
jgi:hypothetical protein